jgi:hypothetical protein
MNRAERAAEKVRKEKEKRAEEQRKAKERDAAFAEAVRQAEAAQRDVTRKDTNKRRYHVGALADEAGLFAWSNADIKAVFAVLAGLRDNSDPGGFLEGVLSENGEALSVVAGHLSADTPFSASRMV